MRVCPLCNKEMKDLGDEPCVYIAAYTLGMNVGPPPSNAFNFVHFECFNKCAGKEIMKLLFPNLIEQGDK